MKREDPTEKILEIRRGKGWSWKVITDEIDIIVDRMTQLNSEIAADKIVLGPGYQIGHSFFSPTDTAQGFDVALSSPQGLHQRNSISRP